MSESPDLKAFLAYARRILIDSCEVQLGRILISVTYEITRDGVSWTLSGNNQTECVVTRTQTGLAASAVGRMPTLLETQGPAIAALTEPDRRVLRVLLTHGKLNGKQIAAKLVPPSKPTTLRGRLSKLKKRGFIDNPGRDYSLTELGRYALGANNEAQQ